jgi:hypothetical protein
VARIPVVCDADTLFGGTTRAFLIHLDYAGLIHMHWSPIILDEMSRALVREQRKPNLATAKVHEQLMNRSLPQASIDTYDVQACFQFVWDGVNSAKDMHVAACACALQQANAYPTQPGITLVSQNLTDFKIPVLARRNINIQHPDAFLAELLEQDPHWVAAAFAECRASFRSAPSVEVVLAKLAEDGQAKTAAALMDGHQAGALKL